MTELLDHTEIPSAELAALFRRRWAAEVPLREIKMSMESDRLRCKSPEMGPQELWAGFLTHHLIRQSMLQAAGVYGERPEHLSFIASIQFMASTWLAAALASPPSNDIRDRLFKLRRTDGHSHRVGNRHNRIEPHAIKRRPSTCSRYPGLKPAPNALPDAHRKSLRCRAQCHSGPRPIRCRPNGGGRSGPFVRVRSDDGWSSWVESPVRESPCRPETNSIFNWVRTGPRP
jgi:hypothetical protein